MALKSLRNGLLAALVLGCAGQKENLQEDLYLRQFPSWWTPPRDVPIEYTDINGTRIWIYRGEIGSKQTYKIGDERNPIWCVSEWDLEYFARKGICAVYTNP